MRINYKKFFLLCADAGLSTVDVIRKANCSTCVLANMKNGKDLRSKTVSKIAAALNVKPAELITEE